MLFFLGYLGNAVKARIEMCYMDQCLALLISGFKNELKFIFQNFENNKNYELVFN